MIRIAQIGVGYWGPNLLRNLTSSPRCRLTHVAEKSADRRSFVSSSYPAITTVEDADAVFASDDIDAVVISTPAQTHYALTVAALAAGKHVLVEKPMATSTSEVDEIGHLAREKGLVAMVGHTFLYNPAVRYLRV